MSQIIPEGRRVALFPGDCLESLRKMPDCSVDSVVTDPPYGLSDHKPADVTACLQAWLAGEPYMARKKGFMGKTWDSWVPGPEVWRECLRVLKPGGHLLAFAGTRTMDLMSMAVRLAGFELRDSIGYAHDGGGAPLMAWTFGSGFPKSTDVSKQIDKAAGVEREVVGVKPSSRPNVIGKMPGGSMGGGSYTERLETVPATEAARQWQGWGSALKPAWEPIIIARKPLIGTIAENVLAHGTGALNIDGCRVGDDVVGWGGAKGGSDDPTQSKGRNYRMSEGEPRPVTGRWPANLILQDCDEVVGVFPITASGSGNKNTNNRDNGTTIGNGLGKGIGNGIGGDAGSAARFFYCAKAGKRDREEGLDGFAPAKTNDGRKVDADNAYQRGATLRANTHPTVKPTDLMRYLCRLVTPTGGVVLDPFMGSGSTGKAAMLEGFKFIGCELSPEYLEIAKARIRHAMQQSEQDAPANDNARPGHEAATA